MNFSKTIDGMKSYNVFGMTAGADGNVFFQDERGQIPGGNKKKPMRINPHGLFGWLKIIKLLGTRRLRSRRCN